MKIDLMKNMRGYKGLHSAVYSCYVIAFSPILTMLLGFFAYFCTGDYMPIGALTRQIYLFTIIFPMLFLTIDLYQIILKNRRFDNPKSVIKTNPELLVLLGFLIWNLIATLIQKSVFGTSLAYTTIIYPDGLREGLFAFFIYGLCLLVAFLVKEEKIVKNILFAFIIVATITAILALIDPDANFIIHQVRSSNWAGLFLNSNHYSYYLTLATTLSAMGVVFSKVRWKWILSLVVVSFFSIIKST